MQTRGTLGRMGRTVDGVDVPPIEHRLHLLALGLSTGQFTATFLDHES